MGQKPGGYTDTAQVEKFSVIQVRPRAFYAKAALWPCLVLTLPLLMLNPAWADAGRAFMGLPWMARLSASLP